MSKIARSYSDKHGLKDLIKEFTGHDISKSLQSSDFGGELSENIKLLRKRCYLSS